MICSDKIWSLPASRGMSFEKILWFCIRMVVWSIYNWNSFVAWARISKILLSNWKMGSSLCISLKHKLVNWLLVHWWITVKWLTCRFICKIVKSNCKLHHLCLSVCLSVCLCGTIGSHWTDFNEIWYLSIFLKICYKNSSFVKIIQEWQVLYMKTDIHFWSYLT